MKETYRTLNGWGEKKHFGKRMTRQGPVETLDRYGAKEKEDYFIKTALLLLLIYNLTLVFLMELLDN